MKSFQRYYQANHDPVFVEQLKSTHFIWHHRIPVIVPYYAVLTADEIRKYGTIYNTGATREERDQHNRNMVKTYKPAIKHILLYSEGVPIAYPDRKKAAEIYFHIKNHVKTWGELVTGNMHMRSIAPPVEDFDLMLEFAHNLEKFLDDYYRSASKDNYFKRPSINRFVENDGTGYYGDNSTYAKLREGVMGLALNRTARVDSIQPQRRSQEQTDAAAESSLLSAFKEFRDQ